MSISNEQFQNKASRVSWMKNIGQAILGLNTNVYHSLGKKQWNQKFGVNSKPSVFGPLLLGDIMDTKFGITPSFAKKTGWKKRWFTNNLKLNRVQSTGGVQPPSGSP